MASFQNDIEMVRASVSASACVFPVSDLNLGRILKHTRCGSAGCFSSRPWQVPSASSPAPGTALGKSWRRRNEVEPRAPQVWGECRCPCARLTYPCDIMPPSDVLYPPHSPRSPLTHSLTSAAHRGARRPKLISEGDENNINFHSRFCVSC